MTELLNTKIFLLKDIHQIGFEEVFVVKKS